MDDKKRMMFILEEDYYFITIKILSILKALGCDKKPFEDYRKLGIIFEFVKNKDNIEFLKKLIEYKEKDIFDNEKVVRLFCDSRLDVSVIKRVLFFLEKQGMIELTRSKRNSNINVMLIETEDLKNLINQGVFNKDLEHCGMVKKLIPQVKRIKLETLQKKVFGYDEVSKWED